MGMEKLGDKSAQKANEKLAAREAELLSQTTIDWEDLGAKLGSQEEYDRLMAAVGAATAQNETVGRVVERLKSLGTEGLALAEKVRGLIPV